MRSLGAVRAVLLSTIIEPLYSIPAALYIGLWYISHPPSQLRVIQTAVLSARFSSGLDECFGSSFPSMSMVWKPLDGAFFLASQIVLFAVTVPAFIPRPAQVIALAVLGWYYYRIIFTQTTGSFNFDYGFGSALLSQYMIILDIALLTPPERSTDFHDNDRIGVTRRPFRKRLEWALKLSSNPRCIGRADEPSHLPSHWPSPSSSRSRFVLSRIFLAGCCFLIAGGMRVFLVAYATTTTADKLVTGAPFHLRVLPVLSFGLGTVCMISGGNAIISASMVGCGLSSPGRWPLLFGSPFQAWSIRRFWRRFWHQMIRRSLLSLASSILGCFVPLDYIGTTSYKLAQLYIVFCISGIVHLGGDVMSSGKLGFKSFTFFMLQPFGITIEIVVSYLWRQLQHDQSSPRTTTVNADTGAQQMHHNGNTLNKNGKALLEETIPPMWVRCVGFIWVTLWIVWTAAYMVDALLPGSMLSAKSVQNPDIFGGRVVV